jgi:hypothetical protein
VLIGFLLKLTFLLTLLFAACIGLIRAQPYDDSELRAFLTPPDGCPMPCLMGIRPGVTTADEAVAILDAHEWVSEIDFNEHQILITQWTGLQPDFINTTPATVLISSPDNEIFIIWIPIALPTGYVHLVLGEPMAANFSPLPINNGVSSVYISSLYLDGLLEFITSTPCPLNNETLWQSIVSVTIREEGFLQNVTGYTVWGRDWFEEGSALC